jgi:hypothetical protein
MNRSSRSTRGTIAIGLTLLGLAAALPASAQTTDEGWQVSFAPYIWGASMEGTAVVRGLAADVDVSASDIFEAMEIGFMTMVAARKGDWGLAGDVVWADLIAENDVAEIDQKLGLVTFTGLRRLTDYADLTFGGRWNHVEGGVELTVPPGLETESTKDWVDPLVGVVLRTPGERRWHATLIADIGGFGVGSDLTWQAFPSVGFDVAKWASVELGWRLLDTDYETGEGTGRFVYDLLLQGPAGGVVFKF